MMTIRFLTQVLVGGALLAAGSSPMAGQLATRKALTLEAAKRIAAAAEAHAKKNNWNVCIAILDDGGHLVYFQRMDGVQIGSVEIAIRKARSAVFFKRPTKAFQERAAKGEPHLVGLPDAMPFEGGLPLVAAGEVLGAIGVSGVTSQQDGQIAQAGQEALAQMAAQ